jgi:hypothetical protein
LFEAAILKHDEKAGRFNPNPNLAAYYATPGVPKLIGVTEQSSNLSYRAKGSDTDTWNRTFLWRGAMSYITGAHALKVGANFERGTQDELTFSLDAPITFRFNNGVPNQLTLLATPYRTITRWTEPGLFVQDRWTMDRLTLTGGLRYDYRHGTFPGVTVGPGEYAPTRNIVIPTTDGTRWHDLEPRTGLAFDVFGDGKTALKFSLNKYVAVQNAGSGIFSRDTAPVKSLVLSTTRAWNDANRNYVTDCDLLDPAANGECGALADPNFGTVRPGQTYDPETLHGWGRRNANWQFSAGVQRQLLPRVSMDASYFRTWFQNFIVTDNRAVAPSDFDTFSITAPIDPRLPGGGGYTVSGLYNLKPASFGRPADNYLTFADNYGKQIQHWNGVDVTVNAQPRPGVLLQGGLGTGRTTTDNCEIVAKVPEVLFGAQNLTEANNNVWLPASNCHHQSPFLTQVKFIGSYQIPRVDVQFSASFRNEPGPQRVANYTATNAVVSPSLGRNLSGNVANLTVNLVEPGAMYGGRLNQLDLRFAKILRFGRTRTLASVDLYNALNGNAVLTESAAFATWLRPQNILNARFAKVVVQVDF